MLKLVGAATVLLAAGLLGMKKYNDLNERRRNLCIVRDGAQKIENTLRCMCAPLYECFLSGGSFFEKAAVAMTDGLMPSEAVREARRSIGVFTKEDKEIIERFADGLCAQDASGQMANLSLFIKELDINIEHAQNDLNTKGTLFVKGSILAAAALVLIII